ncbi:hypothetical protein ACFQX7_29850 [Luedemannella flava]
MCRGPLAVLIDDLQHVDRPTLRLLAYLQPRLDGLPLTLILALTSGAPAPDALTEILHQPATTFLRPQPLRPRGAGAVLGAIFGTRPDDAFVTACHQSTGGNPLLLTELARGCIEQHIEPVAANADGVGGVRLPALVSRVAARLDALAPEVVAVAHAVALLSEESDLPTAAAVAGVTVETAAFAADPLVRGQLLARSTDTGRLSYPHQLLRASAYEHLGPEGRTRGHRAAAVHLASVGAEPELVAAHFCGYRRRRRPTRSAICGVLPRRRWVAAHRTSPIPTWAARCPRSPMPVRAPRCWTSSPTSRCTPMRRPLPGTGSRRSPWSRRPPAAPRSGSGSARHGCSRATSPARWGRGGRRGQRSPRRTARRD